MSLTKRIPEVLGLVAALVLAGGCETLNVKNPNAPDSARLLTDPATVQSIAIGAMRTWFSTTQGPTDGALSAANDVVTAIRKKGLVITDAKTTKMVETMGVLVQALCLSQISLMYDKGFFVDENSDLTSLTFSTRAQMRDGAMSKFDDVINNLTTYAGGFTVPGDFFGKPGQAYTNVSIAQIASTMAARTLAYFPRSAAENADISVAGGQVDWARVVSYAQNGISSARRSTGSSIRTAASTGATS